MNAKKSYPLNNEEELLVLNPEDIINPDDKPLNAEQIEDLEGPADQNAGLELPDLIKVQKELSRSGLELDGDREPCSGGSFGPIFKLNAIETATGKKIPLIERTFTEVKDIERRFSLAEVSETPWRTDSEPRYEIINSNDHHEDKLVIDYLYNEAKALQALKDIPGIPKLYGAVYDDLNGSILEEYIDGEDLSLILLKSKEELKSYNLIKIVEKIKETYTKAAEAGFIHNNPTGATIMLDANQQPYLADWYLYSQGVISSEGPIKDKYLQGLSDLEALEKSLVNLI